LFHSATLSLCNCFAAGVFLATCFLGLIPHTVLIEKKLRERVFSDEMRAGHSHGEIGHGHGHSHDVDEGHDHSWTYLLIDTNLMILIGFLFTLFVEQV
jgi:hypothetical protein